MSADRSAAPPLVQPDVLGQPWVQESLPVRPNRLAPGADRAVLVYQDQAATRDGGAPLPRAVLYLPGFVDYFFQSEHAQAWIDSGIEFYGLDQRGQGRAAAPGHLEEVYDLRLRNAEIARVVRLLRARGHRHVTLLGHSTGGLQAVIYAAMASPSSRLAGQTWQGEDHFISTAPLAPRVDAVVLNSPWLELNRREPLRSLATLLAEAAAAVDPALTLSQLGADYPLSLHTTGAGEFDFDPAWKVLTDFPVRAGFLRSVRRLQAEIPRGLGIDVPILMCTSDAAGDPVHPTPEDLERRDAVLNPTDMHRLAPRLGQNVEVQVFPGGRHDLALSSAPVREAYAQAAIAWVRGLPGD